MQMILLMSVVCAASGFTLEMPELPDLIATVEKVFRGNFTLKMEEEPDVFLPKVSQIETMTREESMERFHWFFCVYVLIFLGVTLLGSVIMVAGPILKSKAFASSDVSDSAESSELLSSEACDLSVSSYQALGPTFTALSARTQQCLVLLSFGVTMSLSLVASLWSLKTGRLLRSYRLLGRDDPSHALQAAHSQQARVFVDRKLAPSNVLRSFLLVEGGSFFVGVLNLLVPGVQILLTFLCFEPVLSAAAPALGKKLNRAMRSGDMVAAAFLWEEMELGSDDLQLFGLILPRLTFLLDTLSRHGFNKDPTELNDEELAMVQHICAAYVGQAEQYTCRNLGELGTKVVAEAMATNSVTSSLYLYSNNIGDAGAQAFAESLKINRSLKNLNLRENNIGAAGAQALGESLKTNHSLEYLDLDDNDIGDAGAQALAESLKINRSLEKLYLRRNNIGNAGAQALGESLKTNVTLEELYLDDNDIGDAGALALAAGLLQNRGLERFRLTVAGAQALAAGKLQNRGLRTLWLSPDSMGDEGCQALEDAEWTKRRRGEDFRILWR
eukprot:s1665_g38.t1